MIGGYRPPLPISEVSGVYEGTNFGFFSRLELYPNGKGLIAYRELTKKKKSEIDIHLITSWKTKENNGIELRINQNQKSNKKEDEIVCT